MTLARRRMSMRGLLRHLPEHEGPGFTRYGLPWQPLTPAPAPGDDGDALSAAAASSATGWALFADDAGVTLVLPPFPVERAHEAGGMDRAPLEELLARRRLIGVFLLRLGGFTCGVLDGATVVASKTDQRFVKNRNRKGGQSQRRFERIREKQVHELFGKACAEAAALFAPHERALEHVFLGGDRLTVGAFRKECRYFDRFGARLMARLLPVAGDPRRASLDAMPREIWSSEVIEVIHGHA
jgi:hypothetical protein